MEHLKPFAVLHRDQKIHHHCLLEASAGTGKTFSIENIVVRLLIEEKEEEMIPTIDQILVVTFTKAATRELKMRIRENIEKTLYFFSSSDFSKAPDYIQVILEQGFDAIHRAKRRLESALFLFDQAQIFTIHAFCFRMLKEHFLLTDFGLQQKESDQEFHEKMKRIILDFFRTSLCEETYSPAQIELLIEKKSGIKELQKELLHYLSQGIPIQSKETYVDLLMQFQKAMETIKTTNGLIAEKVLEDFENQRLNYKNFGKESKEAILEKVKRFSKFFEKDQWSQEDFSILIADDLVWVKALDPLLKKKGKDSVIHYSRLTKDFREKLYPIVEKARNPAFILANMLQDLQKMYASATENSEICSFDDLLHRMLKALQNEEFCQSVRDKYKAAIIDEFQDTDPFQWQIFSHLFLNKNSHWGHLYLVGDPKQSIYAFRQADIYTYLAAAEAIGSHRYSLDTNYRSQPNLVSAFNALFSPERNQGFIHLPRMGKDLSYLCNKSAIPAKNIEFSDDLGSIHFCFIPLGEIRKKLPLNELESRFFFPFILEEITRLHTNDRIEFSRFAFLVRDRYQAHRLELFLKKQKIPVSNTCVKSFGDSEAVTSLLHLLNGVLLGEKEEAWKQALISKILLFNAEEILLLKESSVQQVNILAKFARLRALLFKDGYAVFFQELLRTSFKNGNSVLENILSLSDGLSFYTELINVSLHLIEFQQEKSQLPDALLSFLQDLNSAHQEKGRGFNTNEEGGVIIQTIHASKGLEYDVVIPLGLMNSTSAEPELIPTVYEGKTILKLAEEDPPSLMEFFQEQDAEKMRQFYVALTRAKYRIYLPVPIVQYNNPPPYGSASPIELFLAKFGREKCSYEALYQKIQKTEENLLREFIEHFGKETSLSYTYLKEGIAVQTFNSADNQVLIEIPPPFICPPSPTKIISFSSLAQEEEQDVIDTLSFPSDFSAFEKTVHSLPAGKDTGIALHLIFEHITFENVRNATCASDLIQEIQEILGKSLFVEWIPLLAEMVFNTLKTPLISSFSLCDLLPGQYFKEVEFLHPENTGKNFMKGVIDLVFVYNEKYYIVDWKTNWLGKSDEDYSEERMQNAMKAHHYFLQAEIYRGALEKYIKKFTPTPFQEIFGGIFYLFLRGMQPNSSNGVFRTCLHK